jgi:hypothetical protein
MDKLDEAEAALIKASEQLPDVAIFHYHLAKVYLAKSDKASAKLALQKTIKYATGTKSEQDAALKDAAAKLLQSL